MSIDSTSALELLTTSEVANVLNISVSSVRRLQQGRRIPFVKIGGSIRYSMRDVVSFMEKQRVEAVE